jgi:hypothetical protein
VARVLLDHSVPRPVACILTTHSVERAYQRGWAALKNGDLLDAVQADGFDVFVTSDQNLRHQQNLASRRLAIVVVGTNIWRVIAANPDPIRQAVDRAKPGTVTLVPYPKPPRQRHARP